MSSYTPPREHTIPTEVELQSLVTTFYSDVRLDPLLGPIFAEKVVDWDGHLAKIADFWSSVMLGSRRYKGNPFAAHISLRDRLRPELFGRWLELWGNAARRTLAPAAAASIEQKAHRIAESLMASLLFKPTPTPSRASPPPALP
ncbi:hypothetical protein ASG43_17550 [Aureimonas sp. Leaf454]|uniref:group III truncated hemoglobin n=1 Tax=Aureimonas sp. Leaf454 TaxID=1736381 RepID=UPI0007006709|nr:group III truncated hemoglobin [Aureimonas sp. Leaf454]KQT42079.1 hypothetical protein ASG43_17550 [Aureimonas sp. Leaf454]